MGHLFFVCYVYVLHIIFFWFTNSHLAYIKAKKETNVGNRMTERVQYFLYTFFEYVQFIDGDGYRVFNARILNIQAQQTYTKPHVYTTQYTH